MYAKVNELTKTKISTSKSSSLKNKNGNLLTKPEEIKLRWKEYIEELYAKQDKPTQIKVENEVDVCEDNKGPYLLDSGTTTAKKLAQICQQIYNEGVWPKDFLKTVMIPIEKKIGATDCSDFRTISLIFHALKIVLGILKKRITTKAYEYHGEDQYDFRRVSGTREAIAAMRIICERSLEHDQEVNRCFVDFEKACDRIR